MYGAVRPSKAHVCLCVSYAVSYKLSFRSAKNCEPNSYKKQTFAASSLLADYIKNISHLTRQGCCFTSTCYVQHVILVRLSQHFIQHPLYSSVFYFYLWEKSLKRLEFPCGIITFKHFRFSHDSQKKYKVVQKWKIQKRKTLDESSILQ